MQPLLHSVHPLITISHPRFVPLHLPPLPHLHWRLTVCLQQEHTKWLHDPWIIYIAPRNFTLLPITSVEPTCVSQAIKDPNWRQAMSDEFTALGLLFLLIHLRGLWETNGYLESNVILIAVSQGIRHVLWLKIFINVEFLIIVQPSAQLLN